MTRLFPLLALLICLYTTAHALEPIRTSPHGKGDEARTLAWYDAAAMRLEGKGWHEEGRPFERLPAKAEGKVTDPVWKLSHNTAGLAVRFDSDSPLVAARWSGGGAMNHMAATGVSGLDLYVREESGWQYAGVGKPDLAETTRTLCSWPAAEPREYLLFLPLYQGVKFLEIGVDQGASLTQPAVTNPKPVVFYGTSIVQGGCASRTGMAHPAILRRWLDTEVINLGFSGAGKMEPIMGELLAEIDASVYVLDCLPNMTDEMAAERLEPFVRKLRAARPATPIVLVEHLRPNLRDAGNKTLRDVQARIEADGIRGLHRIRGEALLAGREEATVDGIHPTDLGYYRMAEAHEQLLKALVVRP